MGGTQAATMSASGIDLSTAGALDILGDNCRQWVYLMR